jgi:hypothetical protein
MKAIKWAGGNITSADLVQAMRESFIISEKLDSDTESDGNDVIVTVKEQLQL